MRKAALLDAALLDVEAVAELLDVSPDTVWRLRNSGRLPPPLELSSQIKRWRLTEIREWLAAGAPDAKRWAALRGRRPGT
jgi:predicted DNA-binding transcriptional regulator AlpA